MQGNKTVIDYLNTLLAGELAARDQYFIHSRMYEDWGLTRLYEQLDHEMTEETQHADDFVKRILFLGGTPNMVPHTLNIGSDVESMLKADLKLEYEVSDALKKGIALCEEHHDYVSRDMLVKQLEDTEQDHAYWLEKQLGLIEKMGLENYIQWQAQGQAAAH